MYDCVPLRMKYTSQEGYPVVGYEFGNEPDLFSSAFNVYGVFCLLCVCVSLLVACRKVTSSRVVHLTRAAVRPSPP